VRVCEYRPGGAELTVPGGGARGVELRFPWKPQFDSTHPCAPMARSAQFAKVAQDLDRARTGVLHQPARLRAYPRETVVAEKLEAMVKLGLANSRMKDFYDLVVLARWRQAGDFQRCTEDPGARSHADSPL